MAPRARSLVPAHHRQVSTSLGLDYFIKKRLSCFILKQRVMICSPLHVKGLPKSPIGPSQILGICRYVHNLE